MGHDQIQRGDQVTNEEILRAKIVLLEMEVLCLRSVISEFETDPAHFTQWVRAQLLRDAIETMVIK